MSFTNFMIEINRADSIGKFEALFGTIEQEAWNVAIRSTKKERMEKYQGFERTNDIAKENVVEVVNELFDLKQALARMPKDVADAVWKKCWEVQTEREMLEEDDDME